ncbi:fimbrillin family protein [Elizabethkingia bruuniana]|uniref:Fimbrillin family protein n=1 Tax=Elizabethkingia bruuniana TaxID=1756149 RepID=A0A7T7ZZR6_9FLAO|nr:fimbrillin family protein [Elizabethkingia bruuniana]KGO08451.1 hypothetical protein KS04_21755 [Elizabethkingia miricola]AQX86751.1 hypothetical protein AYC65_17835 [Elizabethkingia bruuniana]KUY27012.1 hypothetical protein ATB97_05815 [Elizabethkingia bruuniana]OPB66554.1 hypothetical protein BAY12_03395 [Elizabethkingia bruuniana]QQN60474.1 fimbrillin family protein [Elizabethkingia bruuniana]
MGKNQLLGLSTAFALALLVQSCKNDDYRDQGPGMGGNGKAQFTSSIGGAPTTRVTGNTWDSKDAIGVFMKQGTGLSNVLASNKKYTTEGNGNFSGDGSEVINYPDTGSVDFIAYYPYTANLSGTTLPVSVATQTNLSAIDVLYSNNATGLSKTSGTANLNFAHKLAKIELTVKAGNGVADVNGLSVAYKNVNTTASLDLATGTLSGAAAPKDVTAKTTAKAPAQFVEAILLPGDYSAKTVVFTLASGTYTWTLPANTTFDVNKKYTFDITLQTSSTGNQVAVTGAGTITDWTNVPGGSVNVDKDGGTDPGPGPGPGPGGTEQNIFVETFGGSGTISNTPIASFTGWDNQNVTFTDSFGTASVRSAGTVAQAHNIWFPAANGTTVTGAALKIDGINTNGVTKLKLTFDMLSNVTGAGKTFDLNAMTFKYNGITYTIPSTISTDNKTYYPITIDLSSAAASATGTLEFITGSTNTVGMRVLNIKLVGTK